MPRTSLLLAGATLLAALPLAPPAHAASPLRSFDYRLSIEVAYDESWKSLQYSDRECEDGRCVRDERGSGLTRLRLRTPTPQRVSVTAGGGIKQPNVMFAVDAGIPLKGGHLVSGSHVVDYRGPWESANPDEIDATSGCGLRDVKAQAALGWSGRNRMQLVMPFDPLREACPNTIPHSAEWKGAGQPDLLSTLATVSESKLRRGVEQFTVRATSESRGLVPVIARLTPDDLFNQSGQIEARWHWEATFRKVKRAKRR